MIKNLVVRRISSASSTSAVQPLPREAAALNVQEVVLQGTQGRLTLREGAKTITVPFAVEGGEEARGSTTRYVWK
jgi:hypothetical protein